MVGEDDKDEVDASFPFAPVALREVVLETNEEEEPPGKAAPPAAEADCELLIASVDGENEEDEDEPDEGGSEAMEASKEVAEEGRGREGGSGTR